MSVQIDSYKAAGCHLGEKKNIFRPRLSRFKSCRSDSSLVLYSRSAYKICTHPFTGTGAVYSFDPVGSYEREACRAAGAAQTLIQPFLDNQVGS